jgi:hypothetical protein
VLQNVEVLGNLFQLTALVNINMKLLQDILGDMCSHHGGICTKVTFN